MRKKLTPKEKERKRQERELAKRLAQESHLNGCEIRAAFKALESKQLQL